MTADRPEPPLKTQQMRKRYRKLRRRQLAGTLLIAGIAVIALLLFLVGLFAVRTYSRVSDSSLRARVAEQRGEDTLPRIVFEQQMDPRPWLTAVSDVALYTAADRQGRTPGYSNYPVSHISAFSLANAGEQLWESELDIECAQMATTEESLVLFSYNAVTPQQLTLRGLDQANGHQVWSQTVDSAVSPSFTISGKVAVVSYWLPDGGYRLVGFNAASGIKAWGYRLPMADELAKYDLSVGAPRLLLLSSGELVCFSLGASVGFIDSGSGRMLRQQEVPASIASLAIDWDNGSSLLVTEAREDGNSTFYRMPIYEGVPVPLHTFNTEEGLPQLLHFGGKSVLAYYGRPEDDESGQLDTDRAACNILYFPKGQTEPNPVSSSQHGIPTSGGAFPDGAHGALLALSNAVDEQYLPTGRSSLIRIAPESGMAHQESRLGRPLTAMLPFRQDIVLLLNGGEVRAYAEPLDTHLGLANLGHELYNWSYSASGQTLLITCGVAGRSEGGPSGPLGVLVLQ